MDPPCDRCPCPEGCPRFSIFCEWMAAESPDPIHVEHVLARGGCKALSPPAPPPRDSSQESSPDAPGGSQAGFPPLWRQAVNLVGSAAQIAASGLKTVSQEEQRRRIAICEGCELFDHASRRCTKCACYMDMKTVWEAMSCPIGLWGGEEQAEV